MAARIPLPFGPNEPNGVYVSQSFGGTFSHKGDLYYSVDFLLGFDAPVLSQGHGTVVEMVENVPDGKPASEGDSDPSMGKSQIGNFVTVQYDEGFYATYQHLKQDGVEVSVGDTVIPNDLLGHVGNTGLRTNTHLHVTYGDEKIGWQAGTIANGSLSANNNTEPVLFATPEDSDGILDAGKYYHGDAPAPENVQTLPGAPPTGSAPRTEASMPEIKEVEPNNIESQVHDLWPLSPQDPIILSGQLNSVDDPEDWFYIHPSVSGNITSKYSDDRGGEDVLTKYHEVSEKVPYGVMLEQSDDGIFNYQAQLTLEPSAPPSFNEKPAPTPENEQDLGGNPPALKDLPPPPPVPTPPSAPPGSAEESAPEPGNLQILPGAPPTGSTPEPVGVALKDLPPPPPVPAPPSAPPASAEESAPEPPASDTVQDLGGEKPSGDDTTEDEKLAFSDLPPPPDIPPPPPPSFSPGSAPEPDARSEAPSPDTVQELGGNEPTVPNIESSSSLVPDDILLA